MKKLVFSIVMVGLLAACGQTDEQQTQTDNDVSIQPIEVDLQAPSALDIGESTTIEAVVTQDGEPVDDADYVEFEVWLDDDKDASETFDSEYQGDGVYDFNHSFDEPGVYSVQSHVQARDMHTMPIAEITVGDVDAE
ncbi:FixH family protein [Aquibacillus sediminis]|uniref:FixH family protein n=1 Tax=Aquibacillus sediminis TaxID=2574734 RepID=UPI001108C277|nr:FixH family protein [Aquibacillus sediminis]